MMNRVAVLPAQPHCFAFGGFEVQMLDALSAAKSAGVNIYPLNPWDRKSDFELLHVWGYDVSNLSSLYWAKRAGKRTVMTALFPYESIGSLIRLIKSRIACLKYGVRVVSLTDTLVVVNEEQAAFAVRYIGFMSKNVHVIPNIVDDLYFNKAGTDVPQETYILCAGNICKRKNQLALARAARIAKVPLRFIGSILHGEEDYAELLRRECDLDRGHYLSWTLGVPPKSPELVSLFKGATAFALLSHDETQPISVLEAAASGASILLSNEPWANQKRFTGARKASQNSISEIAKGLSDVFYKKSQFQLNDMSLSGCDASSVGNSYLNVYEYTWQK